MWLKRKAQRLGGIVPPFRTFRKLIPMFFGHFARFRCNAAEKTLGELPPLACIHPAQGGVASPPPHGGSPRGQPHSWLANRPYRAASGAPLRGPSGAFRAETYRAWLPPRLTPWAGKSYRRQGGLKLGTLRVRGHFRIAPHGALTLSRLGGVNLFQPQS